MKRFIAIILSVFIVFSTGINAYATGAEGAILGGGAEVLGLSLTGPQTALVIAGLLGLAYTVDHADEVYDGMCTAIDTAMTGVENGAEKIATWWDNACSGVIDTASDVWNGVCDWFNANYDVDASGQCARDYKAGTVYSAYDSSGIDLTFYTNYDCLAIPYYAIYEYNGSWCLDVGFFAWVEDKYSGVSNKTLYYKGGSINTWCAASICGGYYQIASSFFGTYSTYDDAFSRIDEFADNWVCCPYYGDSLYNYLQQLIFVHDDVSSSVTAPDALVGGINGALESGDLADVQDVVWPDSGIITLNPALQTDVPLSSTMEGVIDGTLTWEDYWERVTTNPLPGVKDVDTGVTYALDNKGVSENEMEISAPLDTSVADNYRMDLTNIFPFCIPFDLYDFLNCLCAEPEAPNFKWTIPLSAVGLEDCTVEINLDKWDSVAQIFRDMELLAFCIGLAFVTRNLIRG